MSAKSKMIRDRIKSVNDLRLLTEAPPHCEGCGVSFEIVSRSCVNRLCTGCEEIRFNRRWKALEDRVKHG